ncbi:MAG: hypothetical protein WAU65_02470 [Candidatus Nanoarchaeia archaeon]
MNKRGQFYLIAAIIIISATVGFFVVSNYVSSEQNSNIYYQKDEIAIESQRVINYGVFNHNTNAQMEKNLYSLANLYINSNQQNNWYFIFNGTNGLNFTAYQSFPATVQVGNSQIGIPKEAVYSKYLNSAGSTLNVIINNYDYTFPVSGENFFYIISGQSGGQNYTISGP